MSQPEWCVGAGNFGTEFCVCRFSGSDNCAALRTMSRVIAASMFEHHMHAVESHVVSTRGAKSVFVQYYPYTTSMPSVDGIALVSLLLHPVPVLAEAIIIHHAINTPAFRL